MDTNTNITTARKTQHMLHELGIPVHLIGYKLLMDAIPLYADHNAILITKDVYPVLSVRYGFPQPISVERPIRSAIHKAWQRRSPATWQRYFPECEKTPSNKQFIAALAERLQQ